MRTRLIALKALIALCAVTGTAQTDYLGNWPRGASPQEIGRRVAENFLDRRFDFETNSRRAYVIYPEVCTWYGALRVARLIGGADLARRLIAKFDYFLTPEGQNGSRPKLMSITASSASCRWRSTCRPRTGVILR